MSDREKAGLHGPVRTCVEETIFPDGKPHLTTTEYDPDGRLLTFRNPNSDGSEWVRNEDLRRRWPPDKNHLRQFARARP
jgi:hypothetical protein